MDLDFTEGDKEEGMLHLDAQLIKDAAGSFSHHTCHTYDGIHVKNFGMLNAARLA